MVSLQILDFSAQSQPSWTIAKIAEQLIERVTSGPAIRSGQSIQTQTIQNAGFLLDIYFGATGGALCMILEKHAVLAESRLNLLTYPHGLST